VRTLLCTANIPHYLWREAVIYATFLYNRTPHSSLAGYISPLQARTGLVPSLDNIYTFGSICYYKNNKPKLKLQARGIKALYLGYSLDSNIYKVWDIEAKKVVRTRDTKVINNQFSQFSSIIGSYSTIEFLAGINNTNRPVDCVGLRPSSPITSTKVNSTSNIKRVLPIERNTSQDKAYTEDEVDELLQYSLDTIDNEYLLVTTLSNEPYNYQEAINSPEASQWLIAMKNEVKSLESSKTWKLVDLPKGSNLLGGRWVETNSKGKIIRYKARWVVQGFNQIIGIDNLETFSTTVRPECYRIFLIIAMSNKWPTLQYDVKNGFVHADIDTDIYVKQPIEFEKEPTKVCKLLKALYRLKQSLRLWYNYLKILLLQEGFIVFPYDKGIFINISKSITICCHVDDFIISSPNKHMIDILILDLSKSLELVEMGQISTFLGNEFILDYNSQRITMHQCKYTDKILTQYSKKSIKKANTPYNYSTKLLKSID
jgi:hypothetical protein